MKILSCFSIILLAIILLSCGSSSDSSKKDGTLPGYTKTASGLQYMDLKVGTGMVPQKGQTCVVHYHGTLLDGTVFDSSVDRGEPFEFPVGIGRVIKGWDEGVISMKVGGKRKLYIPADLAYGSTARGEKIPANSTLIFEVELLNIK
jgi:peptidylprolyl isomerase